MEKDFVKGFWTGIVICSIIASVMSGAFWLLIPKEKHFEYTESESWSSSLDNINSALNDVSDWDTYVEIYDRWNETERVNGSSIAIHLSGGSFINVYHNCTGYEWFDVVNASGNYSIRYDYVGDYTVQHCYLVKPW